LGNREDRWYPVFRKGAWVWTQDKKSDWPTNGVWGTPIIEIENIESAGVIKSILGLCIGLPTADPPEQHGSVVMVMPKNNTLQILPAVWA